MIQPVFSDTKEEIFFKYQSLVYSICQKRLENKMFLEDAAQSVFLLFFESNPFESRSDLSSWFYWSSVNACIYINRDERKLTRLRSDPSFEDSINVDSDDEKKDEMYTALDTEMKKMPKRNADLILWYYFDNKTYKEIASILNSTEDAIRKRIRRLINKLQQKMKTKYVTFSVSIFLVTLVIQVLKGSLLNRFLCLGL
ncbi:MAG: hypothetical protein COA79_21530 [Planctomycetota bacterium]|nr:MAG: hypothetical protein COA79_21530 [Planctomycetota bacterium]